MKKVFYNSKLAKLLLFNDYSTITICAWVLTKYASLKQYVINHECTHARQWTEVTILSGLILWICLLIFDYSAWYMLIAPAVFYIWYLVEYLIRRFIGLFSSNDDKQKQAYENVSFEQEAERAELDNNYLENSHYFAWLKFYLKKKK